MRSFSIPVAFCSDAEYFKHALVGMISIIKSNPRIKFDFHLISEAEKSQEVLTIEGHIKKLKSSLKYHCVNLDEFEGLPVTLHFSKAMFLRLKIPSLIQAEKVLYLDSDIICNGSIKDLEKFDLKKFPFGAVGDPVGNWNEDLGMKPESIYLNSGVLLINTKNWNENSLSDRILSFILKNKEKLKFPDQCGINGVVDGSYLHLPLKYNLQGNFFREDFFQKKRIWKNQEITEAVESPIFIHFTGPSKPWEYQNNHPYKYLYWKFQKESPLRIRFPEGMKTLDHVKRMFPKSWKKKFKSIIASNPN